MKLFLLALAFLSVGSIAYAQQTDMASCLCLSTDPSVTGYGLCGTSTYNGNLMACAVKTGSGSGSGNNTGNGTRPCTPSSQPTTAGTQSSWATTRQLEAEGDTYPPALRAFSAQAGQAGNGNAGYAVSLTAEEKEKGNPFLAARGFSASSNTKPAPALSGFRMPGSETRAAMDREIQKQENACGRGSQAACACLAKNKLGVGYFVYSKSWLWGESCTPVAF